MDAAILSGIDMTTTVVGGMLGWILTYEMHHHYSIRYLLFANTIVATAVCTFYKHITLLMFCYMCGVVSISSMFWGLVQRKRNDTFSALVIVWGLTTFMCAFFSPLHTDILQITRFLLNLNVYISPAYLPECLRSATYLNLVFILQLLLLVRIWMVSLIQIHFGIFLLFLPFLIALTSLRLVTLKL